MAKVRGTGRAVHETAYRTARFLLLPLFRRLLRIRADAQPDFPRPSLIVANHVTELDFFFTAAVFREPMTFVTGEALLRRPVLGWLLTRVFGCIVKQKGAADARTTMGILRRLREGRSVCLFAEGNTTFDGRTGPIPPATASLVRAVGAGLVCLRIEGGYFTMPRWGRGIRRGKTAVRVSGVYTPQALNAMTAEEAGALLRRDLWEDAYARQETEMISFRGKNPAQGIGRVLYLCPKCHGQSTIAGRADLVACSRCGTLTRYTETGYFEGRQPFPGIREWADWQKDELAKLRESQGAILRDENQALLAQGEEGAMRPFSAGALEMGRDFLRLGDFSAPLQEVTGLEVFRHNTLQFTLKDGRHFEAMPDGSFNALKYRDLFRILKGNKG